jgi:hypothetical protein
MATLKNTDVNDNGSINLPAGTTAQRPGSPQTGMIRYNTDLEYTEFYNGSEWLDVADCYPEARGGIVYDTVVGGVPYRVHKFLRGAFPYVSTSPASSATPSGTGDGVVTGESDPCSGLVTFKQALEYAHSRGCRLPTRAELINKVTAGSGCGYDNELIWTCDKVDDAATQHYVMYGRPETNGTASTPRDNNDTAYVRFVADVDINRSDPNLIDDAAIADYYNIKYPGFFNDITTSADFTVTKGGEVEYLIVAGGGGGGSDNAGGGGAGGLLTGFTTVTPQTFTVTIGKGGQGGNGGSGGSVREPKNGDNSSAFGLVAIGGGHGSSGGGAGQVVDNTADVGGSGGGGDGELASSGAAGTAGQGHAGGNGDTTGDGGGGGGGGAGGPGQNGGAFIAKYGGNGGPGIVSSITGKQEAYAGGGGGGSGNNWGYHGRGGYGGGGDGSYQVADLVHKYRAEGLPNTGGGGGGGAYNNVAGSPGGPGGSGIVVIRYPKRPSTTLPVNDTQIDTNLLTTEPYRHFYNIRGTTAGIDYYYLSTPGDLETRSLVSNFDPVIETPGFTRIDNLALSNDGKIMYVCATLDLICYRLTRPFDPSSAQYIFQIDNFHTANEPTCFTFADHGRKLYNHEGVDGQIVQYDCTIPFDVRTRTNAVNTLTGLGFPNWGPGQPAFNPDGTRVTIGRRSGTVIISGICLTPFDLSTFRQDSSVTTSDGDPSCCIWNRDGTTLYVRHASPDMVNEWTCPTPYSLSGATFKQQVMPSTSFAAGGLHINTDF